MGKFKPLIRPFALVCLKVYLWILRDMRDSTVADLSHADNYTNRQILHEIEERMRETRLKIHTWR